jgi:uncharacterized YigZ family protein
MSSRAYRAPKGPARFEQEIKRSRFIGTAFPASTAEEAAAGLETIAREFPDATHVCWAYLLGGPDDGPRMRFDDAGEPAGTAGRPILNVVQHRSVGDLVVAVVRYFGGIKLGAGGLVRAYSSTASRTLDRLELQTVAPREEIRLRVEYPDEQSARRLLGERGIEVLSAAFGDAVVLTVVAPTEEIASLTEELKERTRGRASVSPASDAI